jgi:1-acyl-sn-glycerol-3-phosphate acyltransferase
MLRALPRGVVLAGTIIEAIAEHARLSAKGEMPLPARAEWLHRWCETCLRRLGVDYVYQGLPPRNALLVANHLSYLDILVLSAITPCIFVAKQEVASWPVFGRMARLSGTIFVDRSRRGDVHSVAAQISEAVQLGTVVVIFPEGGSSNGRTVLPFHSSLLEPAVELQLPLSPAHISYSLRDGDPETDIAYWGDMTMAPHLIRLLSRNGIRPVVRFGEPRRFADRKRAALEMRAEVLRLDERYAESLGAIPGSVGLEATQG